MKLFSKELPTASSAWALSNFNIKNREDVIKFEKENIIDKIRDSIYNRKDYCFYFLDELIDYTEIEEYLISLGYKIAKGTEPFNYWIIYWKE